MSCDTLIATAKFTTTNKQLATIQTEDNFICVIEGKFTALTFNFQSFQLPQIKNASVEYAIAGGIKQKAVSKVQVSQELTGSLLERKDGSTTDMLQSIIKSKENGHLKARFYRGDEEVNGDLSNYKLHSVLTDVGIIIEEGLNHDVDGSGTPSKQAVTLIGNYLPCSKNDQHDASNALASNALKDLPLE